MSRAKAEPLGSMLPLPLQFLVAWLAVWLQRVLQQQIDYLKAENRALMEKPGGTRLQLTDVDRCRLAVIGKQLGRKALAEVATIATPETIPRWYRELVAKKYDGSQRRGLGRPRKREQIADLVLRMARENETWGYTRIKGALQNLGYRIRRNTIKRILQEHGIEPAPIRGKRMPWAKFIKAHLGAIVGMDFPTVEVATLFRSDWPADLAMDRTGHFLIADAWTVRKLTISTGAVTTVVGSPEGFGIRLGPLLGSLTMPSGLAFVAPASSSPTGPRSCGADS